jgi:hypothetical protein
MKKLFSILFLAGLFLTTASLSKAQTKYFVYDNATPGLFNIMLTYEDNSLETVSFSESGQWNAFTYSDYISKETTRPEKGFTCIVVDGSGTTFMVDYRRKSNMVVVKNTATNDTWKLYPRAKG